MLQGFFVHPRSCIRNGEENVRTGCRLTMQSAILLAESHRFRANSEFAPFRHGVTSIDRQVHNNLFNLTWICIYERGRVFQIQLDLNHPGDGSTHNLFHMSDLMVKVDRSLIALGFSAKRQ